MNIHFTLNNIINILVSVFLLFVINRQAKLIKTLEDQIDDLKSKLKQKNNQQNKK